MDLRGRGRANSPDLIISASASASAVNEGNDDDDDFVPGTPQQPEAALSDYENEAEVIESMSEQQIRESWYTDQHPTLFVIANPQAKGVFERGRTAFFDQMESTEQPFVHVLLEDGGGNSRDAFQCLRAPQISGLYDPSYGSNVPEEKTRVKEPNFFPRPRIVIYFSYPALACRVDRSHDNDKDRLFTLPGGWMLLVGSRRMDIEERYVRDWKAFKKLVEQAEKKYVYPLDPHQLQ